MRIVITHPEMGIYLGSFIGLGFWTMLDPAGQPSSTTFADEAEARWHVASWDESNDPDLYGYVRVQADPDGAAGIPALKQAGLAHLLGDMENDALRYAAPAGTS